MKTSLNHLLFDALFTTFLFPIALFGWLTATDCILTKYSSLLTVLWFLSAAGIIWWSISQGRREPRRAKIGIWTVSILLTLLIFSALFLPTVSY